MTERTRVRVVKMELLGAEYRQIKQTPSKAPIGKTARSKKIQVRNHTVLCSKPVIPQLLLTRAYNFVKRWIFLFN